MVSAVTVSVSQIEQVLANHRFRKKMLRPLLKRAAVAMILREVNGDAHILMIKRAARQGDPWSGHMAFPGGVMEAEDRHGFDVACRETEEEIALRLMQSGRFIGRLSELMTHFQLRRRAMVVSPYVFVVDDEVVDDQVVDDEIACAPNAEVSELLWVPLAYLANSNNRERMKWRVGMLDIPLPCYRYQGRLIWGLSLMMLDELLALLR